MRANEELANYRYRLLPGKPTVADVNQDYISAYGLWKRVWREFWDERAEGKQLSSDTFTRQDCVCAVFYRQECVALGFLYECDFRHDCTRDDSYFQVLWPRPAHAVVEALPPHFMIGSNITTHPDWRRGSHGFSLKDLLLGVVILQFLEAGCENMISVMRNNRGINDLAYRFGAEKVFNYYHQPTNLDVDLVKFPRQACAAKLASPFNSYIHEVWNNGKALNRAA